jgi:hypothetical protein
VKLVRFFRNDEYRSDRAFFALILIVRTKSDWTIVGIVHGALPIETIDRTDLGFYGRRCSKCTRREDYRACNKGSRSAARESPAASSYESIT